MRGLRSSLARFLRLPGASLLSTFSIASNSTSRAYFLQASLTFTHSAPSCALLLPESFFSPPYYQDEPFITASFFGMARSLHEWLGPLIESELQAVIEWKASISRVPKIKNDPDTRFSDDGSNFTSWVRESLLPDNIHVQLVKVISAVDPAMILVSDGHTSINATLSGHALAVLEKDIDETLHPDLKGDIISLNQFRVVSTPYGVSDGRVQLYVDDLEYQYHLRKIIGNPTPIADRDGVVRSLQSLVDLILPQQSSGDERSQESQQRPVEVRSDAIFGASQNASIPHPSRVVSGTVRETPRRPQDSQVQTQAPVATQITTQRRRPEPSLSREGYEMSAGVNLAKPSAPTPNAEQRRPVQAPKGLSTPTKLLSVLGKRKPPSPEPMFREPVQEAHQPAEPSLRSSEHLDIPSPSRAAQSASDKAARSSTPIKGTSTVVEPQISIPHGRLAISSEQRRLLDSKDSWYPPRPGHQFPSPNVPVELLKIWNASALRLGTTLDDEPTSQNQSTPKVIRVQHSDESSDSSSESSSEDEPLDSQWLPTPTPPKRHVLPADSIMGTQTPRSQIESPSRMLARPHTTSVQQPRDAHRSGSPTPSKTGSQQLPAESPKPASQQPKQRPVVQNPVWKRPLPSTGLETESSPRNSDSQPRSADSRKSFSQQPPRQPPVVQYALPAKPPPPSSGLDSPAVPRTSGSEQLQADPPNLVSQQPYTQSPSVRNPLPNRPTPSQTPVSGQQPAPSQQSSAFVRPKKSSGIKITDAQGNEIKFSKSLSAAKAQSQPQRPPPSSSVETVIKGTQFSTASEEMEMDVPRPLKPPEEVHREWRRAYFQEARNAAAAAKARRVEWLKANYDISNTPDNYLGAVHKHLHETYSDDHILSRELQEVIKDAFPMLISRPQMSLRLKSSASTPQQRSVRHIGNGMDQISIADATSATPARSQDPGSNRGETRKEAAVTTGAPVSNAAPAGSMPASNGHEARASVTPSSNRASEYRPGRRDEYRPSGKWSRSRERRYWDKKQETFSTSQTNDHMNRASRTEYRNGHEHQQYRSRSPGRDNGYSSKEQPPPSGSQTNGYPSRAPRPDSRDNYQQHERRASRVDEHTYRDWAMPAGSQNNGPVDWEGRPITRNVHQYFGRPSSSREDIRASGGRAQETRRSRLLNGHERDERYQQPPPRQPPTPFQEFAEAWKNIKPGGAFAPPHEERPRAVRGVDVLRWRI